MLVEVADGGLLPPGSRPMKKLRVMLISGIIARSW